VTPAEALSWLYAAQLHGIKLGLDSVRELLRVFPTPDPLGVPFIHVAGTNGKGSVCALLDSACRAAGLRTGLYTSPHLVHFRERIRVNGAPIPDGRLARLLTELRDSVSGLTHPPTFFEMATVAALAHFAEQQVDVAVLETGMGGRLDATNVVSPKVSVLTPIGLDHQQWLGNSLESIAAEKAGIIKPGCPAVSAPQPESVLRVFRETAHARNAEFEVITAPFEGTIGLPGSHQKWNAALAARALELSGLPVSGAEIARGFAAAQWPGRFQSLGPDLVVDGAHNPHAAKQLERTWRELRGNQKARIVLGMMRDKDAALFCAALGPIASCAVTVTVGNERTLSAEEIAGIWEQTNPGIQAQPASSLREALESGHGPTLVTGSLFLVGEALALLGGESCEPSAQ
jgi:dihydrofolate synthase/folylpolyglutamate synthase